MVIFGTRRESQALQAEEAGFSRWLSVSHDFPEHSASRALSIQVSCHKRTEESSTETEVKTSEGRSPED